MKKSGKISRPLDGVSQLKLEISKLEREVQMLRREAVTKDIHIAQLRANAGLVPNDLKPGTQQDRIVVGGVEIAWNVPAGQCTFRDLPVALMWVDTTLAGLMTGLEAMVGPERFALALQAEGRKSVESDWMLISRCGDFREGFATLNRNAAVAGWGNWQLVSFEQERRECVFQAYNNWEGLYQKTIGVCWGSGLLAGKFAGICSKLFGTNCWATQTKFVARGDACDEFRVVPSPRNLESEIESLLVSDKATRADMAVALQMLRQSETSLHQEIAVRKQAEEILREAGSYNRRLIEASLDPLVTIGSDGKITDVNTATEKATGRLRTELVGTDFSEYFTEPAKAKAGYLQAFQKGEVRDYPLDLMHVDGTVRSVFYNASVYRDKEGNVAGVFASARDITERKKAVEALRLSEERFRHMAAAIGEVFWLTSPENDRILYVSPAFEKIWGRSCAEVTANPRLWIEMIHPDDTRRVQFALQALLEGQNYDMEYRILRSDKSERWINDRGYVLRDSTGKIILLSGVASDITGRKLAEKALRAANEYNRSLIEASLDPLVTIGPDGKITDVNAATEAVTGCSRRELVGTDFSDYFTEPEKAKAGYQQAFREGAVWDYPLDLRHLNGRVTSVLYNAAVYRDESGRVIGVFAAARDVTELKQAEEKLRHLAAIVESSDDAIIGKTLDEQIISWNKGAERIYGYTAGEIVGHSVSTLVSPDRLEELVEIMERVKRGERVEHFETTRVRKDGQTIHVALTVSPIRDAGGRIVAASAIARDITGRKMAEEEIQKLNRELEQRVAERTAQLEITNKELEAFAYSVSHDLRAPLRSIDGFSRILQEDLGDKLDQSGRENLEIIRAASQRMAQLIDDILQLSRITRTPLRLLPVDLSALAAMVAEELKRVEPDRRVEFIIQPGCLMHADGNLMRLVLENLIGNAWKFTRKQNAAKIEFGCSMHEGVPVCFVRDNGVGFDMQYASKLFGAFQRLHTVTEFPGTGIGLASVQRIVHRHGGKVWIEGRVDEGATAYFTIPQPKEPQ